MTIEHSSATMDPRTKTIWRKVQISLAHNIYDKLEDDGNTKPMT